MPQDTVQHKPLNPATTTLTRSQEALQYSDSLSRDERDAAAITYLWVQSAAKGMLKSKDPKIKFDEPLFRSKQWLDALVEATARWTQWAGIVNDQNLEFTRQAHSGSIKISEIMQKAMEFYLGVGAADNWKVLADTLGRPQGVGVSNFLDLWWRHVRSTHTDTGLSLGPVQRGGTMDVNYSILYYSMTIDIDHWRSLFVEYDREEFDSYTCEIQFGINMATWKEHEASVRRRLGIAIEHAIDEAPLLTDDAFTASAETLAAIDEAPLSLTS